MKFLLSYQHVTLNLHYLFLSNFLTPDTIVEWVSP